MHNHVYSSYIWKEKHHSESTLLLFLVRERAPDYQIFIHLQCTSCLGHSGKLLKFSYLKQQKQIYVFLKYAEISKFNYVLRIDPLLA